MKVITAIGNPIINNKLREYKEYEVIGKDIQYEEGIFELLEQIKNIDIIFLSNALPEEFDFKKLIDKILKLKDNIKLIVFLKEKNQNIENYLNSKDIFDIFYLNNIEDFFDRIDNNSEINNVNDIEEFKKIIIKSIHNTNIKDYQKSLKIYKNSYIKNNNKIIVITGNNGSGKSIFSTTFSNYLLNIEKKVLLIDLNYNSSTISHLLEIKCKNNSIVNINNNFGVICEFNNMEYNTMYNVEYLFNRLNKYKKIYDYIIIDLPGDIKNKLVKECIEYSNLILYLLEPNLIEMQKANLYLESYIKDIEIQSQKIKLVLNKTNKYKIDKNILESVFSDFEIIGDIEYNEKLNYVINKSVVNDLSKKEFEQIFENINIS